MGDELHQIKDMQTSLLIEKTDESQNVMDLSSTPTMQ